MDHSEVKYLPKVDHTPAELAEWQRTLLGAAAYIEKNGLSCGGQVDAQGRRCVVRVINECISPTYWDGTGKYPDPARNDDAFNALRRSIGCIGEWSDSTPAAEVVARLRAVSLGG